MAPHDDPHIPPPGGDPPGPQPQAEEGQEPRGAPPQRPGEGESGANGPRRLYRARDDRLLGGVCAGLGRYFAIDPVIVRVAFVALAFLGGAGIMLYLAALLLVPAEGDGDDRTRSRALTIAGVVVLVLAAAALFDGGWWWGGILAPLTLLALAGLFVWWVASGEQPAGTPRDVARRALLGLAVLALCAVLAGGAFWAAAAGGGVAIAGVVIAAGAALMAGAFFGGARWLILPALAVALPAGFVAAADIDVDGGFGERHYRPGGAADVRPFYELGAGRLVLDLRDADLPPGDRRLSLDVGMGEAVVVVPDDVCVATHARIGMGAVRVFDDDSGGVDLDYGDAPRAPGGTARLVVDAKVGFGALEVRHDPPADFDGHPSAPRPPFDEGPRLGNTACQGRMA